MSVEMKLGRWEARDGSVHIVDIYVPESPLPWRCSKSQGFSGWFVDGGYDLHNIEHEHDLVRYLGPISPTPACADQAGTPVVSTVSTETAGEQLRRVNARINSIRSELKAYRAMVRGLEWVESDLEELAKRLEKEVEE